MGFDHVAGILLASLYHGQALTVKGNNKGPVIALFDLDHACKKPGWHPFPGAFSGPLMMRHESV